MLLLLVGCSAKNLTPTIPQSFKSNAVYSVGDYSFDCCIEYSDNTAVIETKSTRAFGMVITCDGKSVTYTQRKLKKSFDMPVVTKYNPAVILYQVFSSLPDADASRLDESFELKGKASVGDYSLIIDDSGNPISLSIPNAKITIDFAK